MDRFFKKFWDANKAPIWIMRQAGRYLPEYRQIRSKQTFLQTCYNPEIASEITIQPIRRFGFDAAILFSDILVLPHAMGWDVDFVESVGPVLGEFSKEDDFKILDQGMDKLQENLNPIYNSVACIKSKLKDEGYNIPLIGFAGSVWTVMSYMLEGKSSAGKLTNAKKFLYEKPSLADRLRKIITSSTITYLQGQIDAGADIIKLFDSWSGNLPHDLYRRYVIEPTKQIVSELKAKNDIDIIGFPRCSGVSYDEYINETAIDAVAVDQFMPLEFMKKRSKKLIVQGNLDPTILLTNKDVISEQVDRIMGQMKGERFIFNLGHGIFPQTPIENVEFLVRKVKDYG